MTKYKVIINEKSCLGCGYCEKFCYRRCIEGLRDKFTPEGYLIPTVTKPELCTGCGFCSWMCPHFAIEVFVEAKPEALEASQQGKR